MTNGDRSTAELLRDLGQRLQQYRLQQNVPIAALAARSGVAPRTINRAEGGEHTSLETLVRLLRALGRLDALDAFLPPVLPSPLALARTAGRRRQRASAPRDDVKKGDETARADD